MGFQQQPTLPDYSKLTFLLNNSGVAKWNPPIYEIIKQLIAAIEQSQNTIVNESIPHALGGIDIQAFNYTRFTLSDAQVKTLNSIPVEVIPAPGPNLVLLPVFTISNCNIITGYSANTTIQYRYSLTAGGGGGAGPTQICTANGSITTAASKTISTGDLNFNRFDFTAVASTDPRNKSIYAFLPANVTGGNVLNTFSFLFAYVLARIS